MIYFDLDKIQELSVDMPPTYVLLSDTSRLVILSLLSRVERWQWRNDGERLTDEEWDTARALSELAESEVMSPMLTGTILIWPFASIPDGFLKCDGSEIDRDTILGQKLVNEGCPYGVGDGEATVNIPDIRLRFPMGYNGSINLGDVGGEAEVTLGISQIPEHNHTEIIAVETLINGGLEAPAAAAIPGAGVTGTSGSGEPHNNLPPYLGLNFVIKT